MPDGKELVVLNLDETCVALYHGDQKGNVIARSQRFQPGKTPVQRTSRHEMRACVTHVAIICNNPIVQQFLPQEILGNQHIFLVRDLRVLEGDVPPNIKFIRAKSGWTNIEYMRGLMKRIADAVKQAGDQYWPVLMMDCARQHLHQSVFSAAKRAGIKLVLVPAKLTWLLQPCDTHVFLRYKKQLRKLYMEERCRAASGKVSVVQWLRMIVAVITSVMESHSWEKAFLDNGFGDGQMQTSRFILSHMEPSAMLPAPHVQPTDIVLQTVLPVHSRFTATTVLGLSRPAEQLPEIGDESGRRGEQDHTHEDIPHSIDRPFLMDHESFDDTDLPHPAAASSTDAPSAESAAAPHSWRHRLGSSGLHPARVRRTHHEEAPPVPSLPPAGSWEGPISRRTRSRTLEFDHAS